MKTAAKLLLMLSLIATFAVAQIQPGTFKHIIIVFQENRTPDNLFGSGPARTPCNSEDPFEPGVDIENCGYQGSNVEYLTPASCPNLTAPYVHDFGSILAFIEWNFGIPVGSIGPQQYPFADFYAPERLKGFTPLLDLFPLTQARGFTPISVPSSFGVNYFENYFTNNPSQTPEGPDADDND